MEDETTPCGRTYEHDGHLFDTRQGKAVCDGIVRSNKTHPTDRLEHPAS